MRVLHLSRITARRRDISNQMCGEEIAVDDTLAAEPKGNTHPFVFTLRSIRKAAKKAAQALPVVADNGGPRRKSN